MAFMEPMEYVPQKDHTKLSLLDEAFFVLEDPGKQNMHIGGCWVFEDKFEFEWLQERYQEWLVNWPIFKKKRAGMKWVPVDNFNLKDHIRLVELPQPAGLAELEQLMADELASPLDYSKPLWKAVLVNNYDGEHSVFMSFIHHAITDGQGGLRVLLSMCKMTEAERLDLGYTAQRKLEKQQKKQKSFRHNFTTPTGLALYVWTLLLSVFSIVFTFISDLLYISWKYLMLVLSKPTVFTSPGSTKKVVAVCDPIPLDDVKAVGYARNATVNDVLITTLTQTIHAYLVEQNQLNKATEIQCFMPISLRAVSDFSLGNKTTMVLAKLPISIQDPVIALDEVKSRLSYLKNSWEAYVCAVSFSIFAALPYSISIPWIHFYKKRFQAVLTNVPGPRRTINFHGHNVKTYYALPPQPRPGGLGLAVMTYNGNVTVTVVADKGDLLPSPSHFMKLFNAQFEVLKRCILPQIEQDPIPAIVETKEFSDSGFTSESEEIKPKQD